MSLASLAALALALSAPVAAQERLPDHTALDQYFESLPAADGPRTPGNGPGAPVGSIDPALARQLAESPQGPALRRLATDQAGTRAESPRKPSAAVVVADPPDADRSLPAAVTGTFFDPSGPGSVLLIGAAAIALGVLAASRAGRRAS